MAKAWFVYVIYSVSTGRLYTGASTNPSKRLAKHNAGIVGYTHVGRPYTLVWKKKCASKNEAIKLKSLVKGMRRREKLVMTGLAA